MRIIFLIVLFCTVAEITYGKDYSDPWINNSFIRILSRVYEQCDDSNDFMKCLKIQATKLAGRALKVQNIKIIEGVSIVKKSDSENAGRATQNDVYINNNNNNNLEKLSTKNLDNILYGRLRSLFENHQIQVNIPRMIAYGAQETTALFEGRGKKKDDKKYLGPFIAAVLLKAAMLKMAYHSIAIVAGKALIVGKIALIISAIIGLKKLVGSEGHEKTTYEIVKHPHYQQSHTYSSSHGEYDTHEPGNTYHRSIGEEELLMQDKAYRGHIPRS